MTDRSPIFNVPPVVTAFLLLIAGIHMVRTYLFSDQADIEFLLWNAFVPGRFGNDEILGEQGLSAYWTFVSYSLLHADWLHLAMNGFWMLAFGSAVAQRIGSMDVPITTFVGTRRR